MRVRIPALTVLDKTKILLRPNEVDQCCSSLNGPTYQTRPPFVLVFAFTPEFAIEPVTTMIATYIWRSPDPKVWSNCRTVENDIVCILSSVVSVWTSRTTQISHHDLYGQCVKACSSAVDFCCGVAGCFGAVLSNRFTVYSDAFRFDLRTVSPSFEARLNPISNQTFRMHKKCPWLGTDTSTAFRTHYLDTILVDSVRILHRELWYFSRWHLHLWWFFFERCIRSSVINSRPSL